MAVSQQQGQDGACTLLFPSTEGPIRIRLDEVETLLERHHPDRYTVIHLRSGAQHTVLDHNDADCVHQAILEFWTATRSSAETESEQS